MKRMLFLLVGAVLMADAALAGEPPLSRRRSLRPDSLRTATLPPSDTMETMLSWRPDYRYMEPMEVRPVVSMSSLVTVVSQPVPSQVMVLDNNMLRLSRRFLLSNGQAWNHGPYLNSFLDARTLSLPLPR